MSIEISKVMSKQEFEMILELSRRRYSKVLEALEAREKFKKDTKKKVKAIKNIEGIEKSKILYTKKLLKGMLKKADEALAKDLGNLDEIPLLAEFLRKFQPNSEDIPDADIEFLKQLTDEN